VGFLTALAVAAADVVQDAHGAEDAHAADAGHGADAAHGAAEAGLPQLDFSTWPGQIFWLAVSFTILYLVLTRSVLPKIGGAIEDRLDKIADDLDEAGRLKAQADDAAKSYEQALADARAKAHAIAGETRDKLNAEIAKETEAAEAAFAQEAEAAEDKIRESTQAALANVRDAAADAATAIVEKLVGRAPASSAVASALDAAAKRG
jgi:F-type H+-transporting ATPase subunit b